MITSFKRMVVVTRETSAFLKQIRPIVDERGFQFLQKQLSSGLIPPSASTVESFLVGKDNRGKTIDFNKRLSFFAKNDEVSISVFGLNKNSSPENRFNVVKARLQQFDDATKMSNELLGSFNALSGDVNRIVNQAVQARDVNALNSIVQFQNLFRSLLTGGA